MLVLVTLLAQVACDTRPAPGAVVELSAATLRVADAERLLPGRYDFRILQGWLVRCDTAKGTCCSLENVSDEHYVSTAMKHGLEVAQTGVPGGSTCKN